MADGSEQVRTAAGDLSRAAEQLQTTVARFKVDSPAASARQNLAGARSSAAHPRGSKLSVAQ
jgi:hypothetical protein